MSGLRWATASRIIAQLLTWANTFVVIRLLSPTDFGLAALAGLFANFLSLLSELGFSVALVQRQVRDVEILRHVFGAVLAMGAILMFTLIAGAPLIGDLLKEPRIIPLVRLIAVQFIAMAFGVIPQARLAMDLRFKEIGISAVGSALIGAAVTLISALQHAGAWSLVFGAVALGFGRTALLNAFSPWMHLPKLRLSKISEFSRFSGLVLVERTLWYWYMEIDSLVVGRVLGAAELGIYSVARQLTNIPLERAMEIINAVTLPAYSMVKSDLDHVRRGYLKVLRLGAGYAFPVFWGLATVSDPVVRLVLGQKWLASVPVIQVLCISMPLRMLNSFTSAAATSVARQDVNIKSVLLAIVVIPVCVIFGSRWGVVGVAAAWAIGFPPLYLFNASLVRGALVIPFARIFGTVWPSLAAAVAMVLVLELLGRIFLNSLSPIVHLAIAVPMGALLFGMGLLLVSRRYVYELLEFARGIISHDAVGGG